MKFQRSILSAAIALGAAQSVQAETIEEVIVTADFRDGKLLDLANSVTVIDEKTIKARNAHHLEQLLNLAPNVNFSSGSSRGRFFQVRGIGERSQFVDPVNPSVGLIVDGIDFTGLGLSASTLDIEQVEILRGPQGTLYGANALAGLINMTSRAPSDVFTAEVGAELADYDGHVLNAAISGPLSEQVSYRLAAQSQRSDGYIENGFLGSDNTNNIDELTLRGKLRIEASDDLVFDLSGFYLDADNGYDAFSLNNTRQTLSDQPGWDRQESVAGSVKAVWSGAQTFDLETVVSIADSETEYGYDEDWTFVGYHPFEYSSTDNYRRDRDNISADVRLISAAGHEIFNGQSSWVLGAYLRSEDENLARRDTFFSRFETDNAALYGQLDTTLNEQWSLITGLRVERRNADYSDNVGVAFDQSETLWGGRLILEYRMANDTLLYGLVSRGYKAGGVNGQIISAAQSNPAISPDVYDFDTEFLWNYELGMKGSWLENRLQAQVALFYQDRKDVQAKQSIFNPDDFSFDDFLTNVAAGESLGLEAEFIYLATDALSLFGSIGLLNAEFENFVSSSHVDARDDFEGLALAPVDLDGRDVAHAPNYQYYLGAELALTERWYLRLEVEGKDDFYLSNSHDQSSDSYEQFNTRLGYRMENWDVALWGRNLTNEDYIVRGFYFSNQFGNNPANGYAPEAYYQYGEPRVIGVSANYSF